MLTRLLYPEVVLCAVVTSLSYVTTYVMNVSLCIFTHQLMIVIFLAPKCPVMAQLSITV